MTSGQHEDQLQDNLLDSTIEMLDAGTEFNGIPDPELNAITSVDQDYANFNMDDLLAPVVPAISVTADDQSISAQTGESAEEDDPEHPQHDIAHSDPFFADLSSLDGDDFFSSRPPLASMDMPDISNDLGQPGLGGFDTKIAQNHVDFPDNPEEMPHQNELHSIDESSDQIDVAAVSFADKGDAADILRDFSPEPDQELGVSQSLGPDLSFDPFFDDFPGSASVETELSGDVVHTDHPAHGMPSLPEISDAPEMANAPQIAHEDLPLRGQSDLELPDVSMVIASMGHEYSTQDAPADRAVKEQGHDFDLDLSLGPIGVSQLPDADVYHQKLTQKEDDIQQETHMSSSAFLKSPGLQGERQEPVLASESDNERESMNLHSPVVGTEHSAMAVKRMGSSFSPRLFAASVFAAVSLSVLSTWWWTTQSPQAEKNRTEVASVRADLDKLSKHLRTLEDMTKNGDGVTLLSAYETLSQKQQQLNKEQSNLLSMIKTQQDASVQFENDMINRLEQVVNYTKSVSDRQASSETALRSELAQTVVMEVSAKMAGVDRTKIEQLSAELQQAKQRMLQMDKDVKAQAALVSLLEGETEYVRAQIKKQREQGSPATMPSQVSVRATAHSEEKIESPSFSTAMSDYVVIGVLNSGDNGFEIYLQPREAANTSTFETYYFKPGEQTQVPGYGNILNVQDTGNDEYAVPYQIVTERGVIRGRKR